MKECAMIDPGVGLIGLVIVVLIATSAGATKRPSNPGIKGTRAGMGPPRPTIEQLLTESLKHVPPDSQHAHRLRSAIAEERSRTAARGVPPTSPPGGPPFTLG